MAKYLGNTTKGVGVLLSKDGEPFHLDWCRIGYAREQEADIDAHLEKGNLFGAVKKKEADGHYFVNE
ncbi:MULTISPECIES: hypothetical protein [Rhizobium]|uniref:Uncharacterized protein n=1 Tax=Rhizobium fabae TaxID=573179 RepID=A0A7W6FI11_9HYPH|nr:MULTISPECIES: hypothetical protein [Rhizobium]MBB3914542.1 hypothetical protein [Rhizobium fabae]PDS66170.1 hypothetical protein CO653_10380 [Rhizobium anhuiense]RUM14542.1 hypothetical protein EFB14_07390 [Rhizobium fabae]